MAGEASTVDAADVLRKCFLFQAADEAGRRRLAEHAHRRSYVAGQKIFPFGSSRSKNPSSSRSTPIRCPEPGGTHV